MEPDAGFRRPGDGIHGGCAASGDAPGGPATLATLAGLLFLRRRRR
ncbi:MAG: hypothetical protein GWO04_45455 [Actinobacteria bacterium]|nr:hypothetical protein [Actinomycetota bacterium]